MQILIPRDIENPEGMEEIVSVLKRNEDFLPSHYGTISRITNVFDPENLDDLKGKWSGAAYLTRKEPWVDIQCKMLYNPPRYLGRLNIGFSTDVFPNAIVYDLFLDLIKTYQPTMAIAHSVLGQERSRNVAPHAMNHRDEDPDLNVPMIYGGALEENIPDLYCWNAYGPDLLERYPLDFSSLPDDISTSSLANGCRIVKLADELTYIEQDYSDFCKRRKKGKRALGSKFFFSPD